MPANTIPWRRRLSELGRGVGPPHPPLFAPLLYGVSAQIEALPPAEVTADPTRLGKCLVELRRALGTGALVVAAPSAMEAEALGAEVDRGCWPPRVTGGAAGALIATADFEDRWSQSEALAASLETCQRLAATQSGEPVLLAGLTGPATLLAELFGEKTTNSAEAWDFAGRALAALVRTYAQRGVSALLLCERVAVADITAWTAALATLANIARFHRLPALLAFDEVAAVGWPAGLVPCPDADGLAAQTRGHGLCVPAELAAFGALPGATGAARVVVSGRDLPAEASIEALTEAVEAALDIQRDSGA